MSLFALLQLLGAGAHVRPNRLLAQLFLVASVFAQHGLASVSGQNWEKFDRLKCPQWQSAIPGAVYPELGASGSSVGSSASARQSVRYVPFRGLFPNYTDSGGCADLTPNERLDRSEHGILDLDRDLLTFAHFDHCPSAYVGAVDALAELMKAANGETTAGHVIYLAVLEPSMREQIKLSNEKNRGITNEHDNWELPNNLWGVQDIREKMRTGLFCT